MTKLQNDLEALGLRNGDSLLIHSAFSSLHRKISPKDFIDGVRDVLGNGALLFPTLSWANVTKDDPVFDVNKTPCCTGFLPEFFRTSYEGAIRSIHPTHSCAAVGGNAEWFVCDHELDSTPVGANSPFRRLREAKGKILFLGCGSCCNTSMHGVEELAVPPYVFGDKMTYTLTNRDGKTYDKVYTTHGFANTSQNYDRLEALLPEGTVSFGKALDADCVLMDADAV
ncbi:aminoglycoside 3-N-acetyltransferase [Ruminococcus sp. CAG:382]|nr:aminoglycoside 3-N-acetyltransferase [Ruminococcus sp. CAG:382]